jgi:hypothetical protein
MSEKVNVVAAIIRRAGEILITQRFDRAHDGMWELPGGKWKPARLNPSGSISPTAPFWKANRNLSMLLICDGLSPHNSPISSFPSALTKNGPFVFG